MYSIANGRLSATEMLDDIDFQQIAGRLGAMNARKIGFVAAIEVTQPTPMETLWNGQETTDIAAIGDWIATTLTPNRSVIRDRDGHCNQYVIRASQFSKLYRATDYPEIEFGKIFQPLGLVSAVFFSNGFEILAPWGQIQRADSGYILRNDFGDIYGNNKDTFEATYELIVSSDT